MIRMATIGSTLLFAAACSTHAGAKTDDDYKRDIVVGMHDTLLEGIRTLKQAALDLQAAAPATPGRGWDAQKDAQAIADMRAAWVRARVAYEHVEGALAPLFPDVDNAIDARYDDFLTQLGPAGDANLFDDHGVTGLHAIERILYVDVTPPRVVEFEESLPGYVAAAYPANEAEAAAFKNGLCAKLAADVASLEAQWTPQRIDLGGAFLGLVSLMNEQREKVIKASTFEEESRYSQRTMADIRANLEGTSAIYALFQPWLVSKPNAADPSHDGKSTDGRIQIGFQGLGAIYATVTGDAIPEPPATWSSEHPSEADTQSPFGRLYESVHAAVDPTLDGSVVSEMNVGARILGFPQFVEAP